MRKQIAFLTERVDSMSKKDEKKEKDIDKMSGWIEKFCQNNEKMAKDFEEARDEVAALKAQADDMRKALDGDGDGDGDVEHVEEGRGKGVLRDLETLWEDAAYLGKKAADLGEKAADWGEEEKRLTHVVNDVSRRVSGLEKIVSQAGYNGSGDFVADHVGTGESRPKKRAMVIEDDDDVVEVSPRKVMKKDG